MLFTGLFTFLGDSFFCLINLIDFLFVMGFIFFSSILQLKRDIVDEVAYAVSCKLQSSKDKSQYCNQFPATTKLKYEPKRGRKCVFLEGSSEYVYLHNYLKTS